MGGWVRNLTFEELDLHHGDHEHLAGLLPGYNGIAQKKLAQDWECDDVPLFPKYLLKERR